MAEQTYIPRLKQQYNDVIKDALVKEFGYANTMQVPRLDKVVRFLDAATDSLKTDTGLGTVTRIGKIAMQLQNVGLDEIQFVTVPTEYYPRDSEFFGSVFWTEDADTIWQLINEDKPLPRSVLDTAITAEPPATSSEAQGGGAGETPSETPPQATTDREPTDPAPEVAPRTPAAPAARLTEATA